MRSSCGAVGLHHWQVTAWVDGGAMRDVDTLIKCDEANGQCVVAYSSLSASEILQPALPFTGSNTLGNTLLLQGKDCFLHQSGNVCVCVGGGLQVGKGQSNYTSL